jgi:hypothetical protein
MAKPFFFRIDLIDLMDFATEPEGAKMSLLEFSKELKKGCSSYPAIQKIIDEANNYLEMKKESGRKGGLKRSSTAKAPLKQCSSESKQCSSELKPEAVTEAVTEAEKIKNKRLTALPFLKEKGPHDDVFYLSAKKKKLKGKCLEGFNSFWKAFSYPNGKAKAADVWLQVYRDDNISAIIAGAEHTANERPGLIAEGRTPIYAQGWLSGRRWEDLQEIERMQPKKMILPDKKELEKIDQQRKEALRHAESAAH